MRVVPMPNHSNASGCCSETRRQIAENLYLQRGAADASKRCDVNSKLGDFDLALAISEALGLAPGRRVIDVGCGSGQHLLAFAQIVGSTVWGFDFSLDAVANANRRGAKAVVADAAELPIPAGAVDAVACSFAIYYHPKLFDVLEEFARVLAPGGRVAISGPARGTNSELYEFHRRATGANPSDADLMALGYVEEHVAVALSEHSAFTDVGTHLYTNRIRFPDGRAFLDYWASTSLFARTPGATLEQGMAALADRHVYEVTKRIAVATATRR